MNKLLALLLVSLLVCQATAFSFRLSDNGEDNGEDKGEDNGEFYGNWYEQVLTDQGEIVDQGEYYGNYFFYDNGEINITGFYQKNHSNRVDQGENIYESDKLYDNGEFYHVGLDGHLSKEEVSKLVLKRLRSKNN